MKKITILLSSVFTLLLITSNNASYAAPHITDFGISKFQGKNPNMNAFKGQVRKGNVRKGNVRKGNRNCVDKPGPINTKYKRGPDGVVLLVVLAATKKTPQKSNKLNGCGRNDNKRKHKKQ